MSGWVLTRARLRDDAPARALRHLLVPAGDGPRTAAAHRLVWTLFADHPDRERDFLWREAEPGTFYVLSPRTPEDRVGLFRLEPPRPFEPELRPGDRLGFVLRANATIARRAAGKPRADGRVRGGRCDVVMDALHAVAPDERAGARRALLDGAAAAWLARQGEAHGFSPGHAEGADGEPGGPDVRATGYRVLQVDRGPGHRPLRAGVLDLEGTLTVRDPERFVRAVRSGFGRARAFGCGLMLLRRVR